MTRNVNGGGEGTDPRTLVVGGAGGVIDILCSGPGPHVPVSGILGQADRAVAGMLCPSTACQAASIAATVAATAATANQSTIQQQAQTALANNRAYLAIGSPTNGQVLAQTRALTQQVQALIRLALNQFDATN